MAVATQDRDETNSYKFCLPESASEAIRYVFNMACKLTNERRLSAEMIRDQKHAARNDGFSEDELSHALRLKKKTPEARTRLAEAHSSGWRMNGFGPIAVADDDPKDKRLDLLGVHVRKIMSLEYDKREISDRLRELYGEARDAQLKVGTIKALVAKSRLDATEREDYLHDLDQYATVLGFW